MKTLLLLSDMWGKQRWQWLEFYEQALQTHFQVQKLDVCELGGLDLSTYKADIIHQQFLKTGIEKAVCELLKFQTNNLYIIAFSIGGTIAWKAIERELNVQSYYAISATRLRYETLTLNCSTKLFYGDKDDFRPSKIWLENMKLPYKIFPQQRHECYKDSNIAAEIIHDFLLNANNL